MQRKWKIISIGTLVMIRHYNEYSLRLLLSKNASVLTRYQSCKEAVIFVLLLLLSSRLFAGFYPYKTFADLNYINTLLLLLLFQPLLPLFCYNFYFYFAMILLFFFFGQCFAIVFAAVLAEFCAILTIVSLHSCLFVEL